MRSMGAVSDAHGLLRKGPGYELPKQNYVSLSEALSWLAFGLPLKSEVLSTALEFGGRDAIEKARLRLIKAVDRLADIASDGRIRMRGKFVRDPSYDESGLRDQAIPAEDFHDFARFDVLNDGLNFGRGLAWSYSPEGMDTAFSDRPGAAYHSVKIRRADLLDHASKKKRASPYKRGQPPDRQSILDKADEMRRRGMNGREIAANMHKEAGFEGAYNILVRREIKGIYPRGPRKKASID